MKLYKIVKCVQAEVRVLLVGMMGRILDSDTRGMSVALLREPAVDHFTGMLSYMYLSFPW